MKKSRIVKFALLGASTAALVGTLSTSTYAWYVSNKQANLTGGTGATGSAESDGSVSLSWSGTDGEFYKSIDFAQGKNGNAGATDKVANALSPVSWSATNAANADAPAFYGIASDGSKGSASTAYIQFTVYVKCDGAATVTPTITLTTTKQAANNGQQAFTDYDDKGTTATTDDLKDFLPYKGTSTARYEKGETFTVDAKYALYTKQEIKSTAVTGETAITYIAADNTTSGAAGVGGDAHKYYEAVTGNEPWAKSKTADSNALSALKFTASGVKEVQYTIYLDGGDTDCFNSCALYDVAFSIAFNAATTTE